MTSPPLWPHQRLAVEYPDGAREWFRDGLLHRESGPAIECPNGTREWFRDGVRQRS